MRPFRALLLVTLLVAASVAAFAPTGLTAAHPTPAAAPVTGNITGKDVLALSGAAYYLINGTGGPAFAANGTQVGNFTYYASVAGTNTTGISITPSEGAIDNFTGVRAQLSVGAVAETLTIDVEFTSVYQTANVSTNVTYVVTVVQPYVLTLNLISQSTSTIEGFVLNVYLDGTPIGTLSIPTLTAHQSYTATFQYATLGLSSGEHTFTVSLSNEHGLVTFPGGTTSYSQTFWVPGAPPSYTLWYLAGAVAFFGAIFIFVTRVAARRRNPSKKS
jgi:hypothetical protein